MDKGPVVTKWTEPRDWHNLLLRLAKENSDPKTLNDYLPPVLAGVVILGTLIWSWLESDEDGLLSTITTVGAFVILYGAIYLILRTKLRFCPTRVWIRENGIEMGELLGKKEWTGFSEMEGFFFDSDTIKGKSFRSLNWLPAGAQYPDSSVFPQEMDETKIRSFLSSKGLEELQLEDDYQEKAKSPNRT